MKIFPDISEFQNNAKTQAKQVVYSKISSDLTTPVAVMMKFQNQYDYCFLFESVEGGSVRGRYSIIGLGNKTEWKCNDGKAEIDGKPVADDALSSLKNIIREQTINIPAGLPPMATGLFGYLGYDAVRLFEDVPNKNKDELGVPDALLFMPEIVLIFDSVQDSIFLVVLADKDYDAAKKLIEKVAGEIAIPATKEPENKDTGKIEFKSNYTKEQYFGMVEKAKEYIRAGDIFQLVPSQRFTSEFKLPPFSFYRSLRHLNPSPFLFFLKLKDFHIIGSSPEILVRLRDDVVTIRPIAGTRKRGANKQEDKELSKDLLSDQKELAEHLMLLDLGRNDVGRVAQGGSVKVTERMIIEYYSHVMHIVSNVEGKIAKGKDAVDALAAGFPAGTVSGAPKIRAMEIIDELENVRRKFYGGGIGYFAGNQMDSCIALRTAMIKDGKIYLQAGGGVVADSDPEAEYQETINKAKALMKAAEEAKNYL